MNCSARRAHFNAAKNIEKSEGSSEEMRLRIFTGLADRLRSCLASFSARMDFCAPTTAHPPRDIIVALIEAISTLQKSRESELIRARNRGWGAARAQKRASAPWDGDAHTQKYHVP